MLIFLLYWKFNNSLLKDLKYVQEIKQAIQNVKEQYASDDQTELADIKDVSNQNIKFDINNLRKKKMEDVKVRSRARWICDGEKVTKYFCHLETRHYVSKCMNSLISNSGNLIQDQNEILSETMQFYKNLYTKKGCYRYRFK